MVSRTIFVQVWTSLLKNGGGGGNNAKKEKRKETGKEIGMDKKISPSVYLLTSLSVAFAIPPSSSLHLFLSIILSLVEDSNPIRINIPGEWASFHCSNYKPLET